MSHPITPNSHGRDDDDRLDQPLTSAYDDNDRLDQPLADANDGSAWSDIHTTSAATSSLDNRVSSTDRDSGYSGDKVAPQHVAPAPTVVARESEPADLLTQEKQEFGGIKFGSALLGWLTTVGTIAVLAAILAAIASGLNLDSNTSTADLKGVGLGAAIALLVVLFLGYLAGGYVAGRMARFHGIRQGLAVWLWGLVIAIALSITAAIIGNQSTVLVQANLPQIPFTSSGLTWQAILALVAVLLATLLGALLGGLWGMRFHRKIDKFAANTDAV